VSETVTRAASPFARGLVWKQTNQYMYEDDTPLLARESALRPDLIKELLFSSHLRPKIPTELMRVLGEKLRRTAPGYPPGSALELLDWVKERLLIPEPEWKELAVAIRRDHGADAAEWFRQSGRKLVWISWPGVGHPLLSSLETLPKVLVALRLPLDDISMEPVSREENAETLKRRIRTFLRETPEAAAPPEEYDLPAFLSAWLAFYGPMEKESVKHLLGVTAERLDEAIEPLIEAQDLVMDRFGEESSWLEICDSENLEMLLRMARRYRQPSFQALPLEQFPLFLAAFQGITPRGESMEDLQQRLEQLFGWPARVEAWEEYLLPARMQPYRSAWLDSLMASSDLIWFGCGERRVSLAFSQDLGLFRPSDGVEHSEATAELDHLIPDRRGRYSFLEIADFSHLDSVTATERLWKQAWKGSVTSDTFRTIRKGVMTGFTAQAFAGDVRLTSRRSGFDRWKVSRPLEGHWRRIDSYAEERDILKEEELVKDRIRQLLRRYGILFRELVVNELPPLQWRAVFRSIRLMELSGEVLSGYFFQGIPGPQFISHEAFRMLRDPFPQDAVFWVNAADPASLCGLGLESLPGLPPRIPSTHLVYHGSRLAMISKRLGKNLEILAAPDNVRLTDYVTLFKDLLNREFNPMQKISVETVNGEPALRSPYVGALKQVGFRISRTGLELWKEY
jgi:ATP-dependent Lhr-like helicase